MDETAFCGSVVAEAALLMTGNWVVDAEIEEWLASGRYDPIESGTLSSAPLLAFEASSFVEFKRDGA